MPARCINIYCFTPFPVHRMSPGRRLLGEYLRFYFCSRDGCRPGRLLFDLRLIGKSYGPSRDRRAAGAAAAAPATALLVVPPV